MRARQDADFQGRRGGQDTGPQRRVAQDVEHLEPERRHPPSEQDFLNDWAGISGE